MSSSPSKETDVRPKRGSNRNPPTNAVKPGQVLNPHGAPRKGMSTAEIVRTLRTLTPDELRRALKAGGGSGRSGMEQALAQLPQGVPLGLLMHGSAIVSTINEPQPGILTYLRDTSDGKPVERREVSGPDGEPVTHRVILEFRDTRHQVGP